MRLASHRADRRSWFAEKSAALRSVNSVDTVAAVVLRFFTNGHSRHGKEVTDMPQLVDAAELDMSIDASCRLTGTTA